LKSRTHRDRKILRLRRLQELIRNHQMNGKRFGHHWRINKVFDYWPNSGRVLDRRNPDVWIEGHVSGPDEMVMVARGAQQIPRARETPRRNPARQKRIKFGTKVDAPKLKANP
jgi:hypothetical protein